MCRDRCTIWSCGCPPKIESAYIPCLYYLMNKHLWENAFGKSLMVALDKEEYGDNQQKYLASRPEMKIRLDENVRTDCRLQTAMERSRTTNRWDPHIERGTSHEPTVHGSLVRATSSRLFPISGASRNCGGTYSTLARSNHGGLCNKAAGWGDCLNDPLLTAMERGRKTIAEARAVKDEYWVTREFEQPPPGSV
jgi:hypothetical protein